VNTCSRIHGEEKFVLAVLCVHQKSANEKKSFEIWFQTGRRQFGLHYISIPVGWKVKEEESHSEECSISIDEQVQDRISVSIISGYYNCDIIFFYDTNITGHEEISYQEVVF
jgi:hypothetical protein